MENYQEKIQEEAEYWGEKEDFLLKSGYIPLWFDLRRAQKIPFPKSFLRTAAFRLDPVTHDMLMGNAVKKLINYVTLRKKGSVIELGSGSGWLSLELARAGMDVTGLELSAKRVDTARKFAAEAMESEDPLIHGDFGSLRYEVADLNRIVLPEMSFDSAVACNSLHHIPEIEHLIEEIHKSLKPDGQLIYIEHFGTRLLDFMYKRFSPQNSKSSPFEDAAGKELLTVTDKFFKITESFSFMFFSRALGVGLRIYLLPDILKIPALYLLKAFDNILISTRLTKGEFVFVRAVKK